MIICSICIITVSFTGTLPMLHVPSLKFMRSFLNSWETFRCSEIICKLLKLDLSYKIQVVVEFVFLVQAFKIDYNQLCKVQICSLVVFSYAIFS